MHSSLKPPLCKSPWLDNRICLLENSNGFNSEKTTWTYSLSTLACVPETPEGVLIDETPAQLFNFEETQDQWQQRGASFNNQLTFDSSQQGRRRGLPIGGKNKFSCHIISEQINRHPQPLNNSFSYITAKCIFVDSFVLKRMLSQTQIWTFYTCRTVAEFLLFTGHELFLGSTALQPVRMAVPSRNASCSDSFSLFSMMCSLL